MTDLFDYRAIAAEMIRTLDSRIDKLKKKWSYDNEIKLDELLVIKKKFGFIARKHQIKQNVMPDPDTKVNLCQDGLKRY